MAHSVKYRAEFKDKLSAITFRVDILQDPFGGGIETITYMAPVVVTHKYHTSKGKDQYVIGSSLTFSFMSLPADSNKYDSIFEGDLKEFKIKYYEDSVFKWEGYIQSDNLQRTYLNKLYTITLNATDWLSNLKDVEFRNGDTAYANEVSVLQLIKTCLEFTGIELDFYTQINTYETTYMTSTTDVLNNLFVNQSRFTTSKDGKTKYTSVYNVLTETLKPLNLTLKQVAGRYHLINVYEIDSFYRIHTWSTLAAGARTATDHIIDIDDSTFETTSGLSKLKPELRIDIKRFAHDSGGEFIGDLSDFSGGGPWTINAPDGYTQTTDRINITDNDPENNGSYINVTSSSQTGLNGRYMSIEFDSSFIDTTWYLPLRLDVKVTKPISGASTYETFADPETGHFQSPISDMFELDETGVYIIEINVSSDQRPGLAGILTIQNVRINADVIDDAQFDRNYIGYIDQDGQVKEEELFFADADTDTDKGGFKADSSGYVRTLAWNRYGLTDGITIQEIFTLNVLKNRQNYKDFISINVIDNSFAITASSIIQIDSVNHKITEIETIYNKNTQKLKIERIFESDPAYVFSTSILTTIGGESTNIYNPVGSNSDHGSMSGLGDDDHIQYHNNARGDARYYTKTLLDGGQLDNRYFRENEHINTSSGSGDAAKPIVLDVDGHVDATMINDADIDHGSIGGLGDDDHSQYHNDTRGDARYYTKTQADDKYAILAAENNFTENQGIDKATLESWSSTFSVLEIGGQFALMGTTAKQATSSGDLMNNAYFDGSWKYVNTDEASIHRQLHGTHLFSVAASGTADTAITWIEALEIDVNGDVTMVNDCNAQRFRVYESTSLRGSVWYNNVPADPFIELHNNAADKGFRITDAGLAYCQPIYDESVASSANVFVDSSGWLRRATSSKEAKTKINHWVNPMFALKFKPCTFTEKRTKIKMIGFVAEEINEVDKRFANNQKEEGMMGIELNAIVAALTSTIQMQQEKINENDNEIKRLKYDLNIIKKSLKIK